jgi:hypothetical protein
MRFSVEWQPINATNVFKAELQQMIMSDVADLQLQKIKLCPGKRHYGRKSPTD